MRMRGSSSSSSVDLLIKEEDPLGERDGWRILKWIERG